MNPNTHVPWYLVTTFKEPRHSLHCLPWSCSQPALVQATWFEVDKPPPTISWPNVYRGWFNRCCYIFIGKCPHINNPITFRLTSALLEIAHGDGSNVIMDIFFAKSSQASFKAHIWTQASLYNYVGSEWILTGGQSECSIRITLVGILFPMGFKQALCLYGFFSPISK